MKVINNFLSSHFFGVFILLFGFTCPVLGQDGINLHEGLVNNNISEDGRIISYFIYKGEEVILNVKDLHSKKDYHLSGVHKETIINNDFLLAMDFASKKLFKINFENSHIDTLYGVDEYRWLKVSSRIVCSSKSNKTVMLYDKDYKQEFLFTDVQAHSINEESERILIIGEKNEMYYLSRGKINNISSTHKISGPKKIVWDNDGINAYIFTSSNNVFTLFKVSEKQCSKIYESNVNNYSEKFTIDTSFSKVRIMNKHQIAIGLKVYQDSITRQNVVVWKGNDSGLTSEIEKSKYNALELGVIDLKKNNLITYREAGIWQEYKISNDATATIFSYIPNELEDFTKQYPYININKVTTENIKKQFIGRTESNSIFSSKISPLLFFFNSKNWFYYDKNTVVNLTNDVDDLFYDVYNQSHTEGSAKFYRSFFSFDKDYLILEGLHNIWFFNTKTKEFLNKTRNQNVEKHYSVEPCNATIRSNSWGWNSEYDIYYKDVVLRFTAENHSTHGLAIIDEKGKITDLVNCRSLIKDIKRSKKFISYIKENPNAPPALYIYDILQNKETCVFQSNKWDVDAKYVDVKYLKWNNSQLEPRGAIVRYPLDYDPSKKYPAIVDIYEKKYSKQYDYLSPVEVIGNGINYRDYINNGYFVIEPDIHYEIGNPGMSALNCVMETIEKMKDLISIDSQNIGLIGHSFGGYQVNFILTQTNLFKAAVSSAGVFDLESHYFNLNWTTMKPDMWRMETQQFRMGKSIFEIPKKYYFNSPKNFIHQVTTPVMLLVGQKDYQVNWNQSISMYLALNRLEKNVTLALYPTENHVIMDLKNRIDSRNKIKNWFDFYLKGITADVWFK